ncbi:MAG TPA: protein-L-isoaspartate(D-aspartate) O-methyltransferase [Prosthecobacter sp.]|nr:protein-L-isoaspartate(D-aspartate) O-methyltransferase [Prosthecobacter sp.]
MFPALPSRGVAAIAAVLMSGCCEAQTPPRAGDFRPQRERMVREQLMRAGHNIQNQRVLEAMRSVPRHEFVPKEMRAQAYADEPLPIGHGQTISQPYIVAFMTEAINPQPGERILEIGTGSGYQAAVLAAMGAQVFSIEIVKPLGEKAGKDLRRLGYDQVKVRIGDGYAGWPEEAPFDAVIVTCAPENIPQPLIDQLKTGGRMIIPVGEEGGRQELYLLKKTADGLHKTAVLPVRFVPMTGKAQKGGD